MLDTDVMLKMLCASQEHSVARPTLYCVSTDRL